MKTPVRTIALVCLLAITLAGMPGFSQNLTTQGNTAAGKYGASPWALANQRYASAFNYDIDSTFQTAVGGAYTFPQYVCQQALTFGGNINKDPFNTNATVNIVDQVSANTETVALTAKTYSGSTCTLTLAANNAHSSYHLRSGTCGLKEALNDVGSSGTVIVDQKFVDDGCTASTITGLAGGATGNFIHDISNGKDDWYGWNGSAFVKVYSLGATGVTLSLGTFGTTIPNAAATGTTVNKLAKLTGVGTAVIAATTDNKTGIVIGIVTSGAGTTGSAVISSTGKASCVFDGATTANDFVTVSTGTAGDCTDAGATEPTDGSQVLGRVLSTNGGGGTYSVFLFPNTSVNANTAIQLTSATANPATAGVVELAKTDSVNWRNNANAANIGFTPTGAAAATNGNVADVLQYGTSSTGGLGAFSFVDMSAAAPANSGIVRLNNNTSVNWRNAANGADIGLTVDGSNLLKYSGTAPTDGYYFVGPEQCSAALTTGTFAANPATSGGASAPALIRAASGNTVLQVVTTGAANTLDVVCDFTPPSRITAGKGITITSVSYLFGYVTNALTSIGTFTPNSITYHAPGATAQGTVASIGGALTANGAINHGTPPAATTSGQCYNENVSFGTPYAVVTDLTRLAWQNTFSQSGATASTFQICGTIVYYSNINSL